MEENFEGLGKIETFDSPDELVASMQPASEPQAQEPEQQVAEAEPQEVSDQEVVASDAPVQDQPAVEEPQPEVPNEPAPEPQYSDQEIEEAVFSFLSDRLGRQIQSIDDISQQEENSLDERVEAIARFVKDTGRAPEDWFRYQSLNPEGMDDMTAIRVELANEYPNLSFEELNLLVGSKYKLDPDSFSEDEVRLSQLQLKIDADKARRSIEDLRTSYSAPEQREQAAPESQSLIDDQWIAQMSQEVDLLTGLEFDLGDNKTFEFGLDDQYKTQLKDRNSRLDEFFDPYVNQDGTWDYDKLSSHMAVLDNIDRIVKSAYTKGLGDGQRTIVDTAANVSTETPNQGSQNQQTNPLTEQLRQALGNQNGFGFI